jgi:DNA invertase Pin-like site-specific DNA recombinase
LVIAKLDRLARSVHFLAGLMESGCEFVAVDMPEANRMVLHIMAAMAEQEARAISERTKVALAAAKRRGVRLGRPENLTRAAQRKGARVRRSESLRRYRVALELIQTWRGRGLTLWECARRLDEVGLETARGGSWTASTVGWLLKRAA